VFRFTIPPGSTLCEEKAPEKQDKNKLMVEKNNILVKQKGFGQFLLVKQTDFVLDFGETDVENI